MKMVAPDKYETSTTNRWNYSAASDHSQNVL